MIPGPRPFQSEKPFVKPLARVSRPTDAPALEVRRTFRFDAAIDAEWQEGAVAERVEFSEYIRRCIAMGHSVLQGQRAARRTLA